MAQLSTHIILAFLWILYCFLHSLIASSAFKNIAKKWMNKSFAQFRLLYNLFAAIGFIAIVFYQSTMKSSLLYDPRLLLQSLAIAVAVCGLILMAVCVVKYFKGLSGLQKEPGGMLMIKGIHQWVRHPLYLGTFLFIWGGFIAYPLLSLFLSNSIITIYTLIGIRFEEKKLVAEFGDAYKAYQRKVPMIIPMRKAKASNEK